MTAQTTAQQHRSTAAAHDTAAQESFERSDTDGFMSQWAHGVMAQRERLAADIAEDGGRAMFLALFDTNGNLVPAKYIETRFGYSWALLSSDDPRSEFKGWFNPSKARKVGVARTNDAKKGYYVGYVMAPAKADLGGGNLTSVRAYPKRIDGGFSRDVEIVDNGQDETNIERWYKIHSGQDV